jgi:allophycocyanin-B
MDFQLSDRAKQLIPKARIVSFATWDDWYSPESIARFQAADDAGCYLSDTDLAVLADSLGVEAVRWLRDHADEIVTAARSQVLERFPQITESGGELYPPPRAQACWRDFWHFLRCITYGIAGGRIDYTSEEGLQSMEWLYQELKVPLPAMVVGLEALKEASLQQLGTDRSIEFAPYFDRMISELKRFRAEPSPESL